MIILCNFSKITCHSSRTNRTAHIADGTFDKAEHFAVLRRLGVGAHDDGQLGETFVTYRVRAERKVARALVQIRADGAGHRLQKGFAPSLATRRRRRRL